MTIFINDQPAEIDLVKRAMRLLRHSDFEELAMAIEFSRSKGNNRSSAKVTGKVLYDAIKLAQIVKEQKKNDQR